MSNAMLPRPRHFGARRAFAVVASEYNKTFVDGLVENFTREMGELAPSVQISTYSVPGAFEIPLFVEEIASRGGFDAIVAFGVIIQGETKHADFLGQSITSALLETSLDHRVPVIHEVLLVKDEAQAQARCLGTELNRGVEAARSAIKIAQAFGDLKNTR